MVGALMMIGWSLTQSQSITNPSKQGLREYVKSAKRKKAEIEDTSHWVKRMDKH